MIEFLKNDNKMFHVPKVITELSAEKVFTTEFVKGVI